VSKLIKRARLAGKILRFVPFLRMAALNGSIVRGQENKESDIDILIIARAGRLYICRFFAILFIHFSGWRRHGRKIAGRICLNCFLSNKDLSIFPENKKSASKVAKAYKYLIPLVDDGSAKKFFKTNAWFDDFKINGASHCELIKDLAFTKFPLEKKNTIFSRLLSGKIGDWLEKKLMSYQVRRILSRRIKGDETFADRLRIKLHPKKIE
jgi:hypothetical protein